MSLIKRINGLSTPVFGVQWTPKETERDIARKLLIFLEDRRALYNLFHWEITDQVNRSIIEIRTYLTSLLQDLDDKSNLTPNIRILRAACRKYLDENGQHRHFGHSETTSLGELRGVFGLQIAEISVKYGLDVEGDLSTILPVEDQDD